MHTGSFGSQKKIFFSYEHHKAVYKMSQFPTDRYIEDRKIDGELGR